MVIVGLFGSNALGGLSGSLSLELDRWHWLFCSKYHLRNIMLNSRQRHIKKKMNIIKRQIFILVDQ